MWDIVILNQVDDKYIVMTPNSDVHCISEETFQLFKRSDRVSYIHEDKK